MDSLNTILSVPGLGTGTRQRGGIVPAAAGLASSDGLVWTCDAGERAERITAGEERGIRGEEGVVSEEFSHLTADTGQPISLSDSDSDTISVASTMTAASLRRKRKTTFLDGDSASDEIASSQNPKKRKSKKGNKETFVFRKPDPKDRKKVRGGPGRPPRVVKKPVDLVRKKPPNRFDPVEGRHLTAPDVGAKALDRLDELELLQNKSANLKGPIPKEIRYGFAELKDIVRVLTEKATAVGDPLFLKTQVQELQLNLECKKEKTAKYEGELKAVRKQFKSMQQEMMDLKRIVDTYREMNDIPTIDMAEVKRPPLKGVSTTIPTPRQSSAPRQTPPRTEPEGRKSGLEGKMDFVLKQVADLQKLVSDAMNLKKGKKEESPTLPTGPSDKKAPGSTGTQRKGLKVTENRIIAQPIVVAKRFSAKASGEEVPKANDQWTTVVNKKDKRKKPKAGTQRAEEDVKKRRKPPKTAAVSITNIGNPMSYAEILTKARQSIDTDKIGIDKLSVRHAINGGRVLEIRGEGNKEKARDLASQLSRILPENIIVRTPEAQGKLKITNLEESVYAEEIQSTVSKLGECGPEKVKVGKIARMRSGMGMVWLQAPLAAAIKVANLQKFRLGWTSVRVQLLETRQLQCYKCWRYGHIQAHCDSKINRAGCCFKCGAEEHVARACTNKPKCMLCIEDGRNGNHRIGSGQCKAKKKAESTRLRNPRAGSTAKGQQQQQQQQQHPNTQPTEAGPSTSRSNNDESTLPEDGMIMDTTQ